MFLNFSLGFSPLSLLLFSKHSVHCPSPRKTGHRAEPPGGSKVPKPTSSRHSNGGHYKRASYRIFHGHNPVSGVVNSS